MAHGPPRTDRIAPGKHAEARCRGRRDLGRDRTADVVAVRLVRGFSPSAARAEAAPPRPAPSARRRRPRRRRRGAGRGVGRRRPRLRSPGRTTAGPPARLARGPVEQALRRRSPDPGPGTPGRASSDLHHASLVGTVVATEVPDHRPSRTRSRIEPGPHGRVGVDLVDADPRRQVVEGLRRRWRQPTPVDVGLAAASARSSGSGTSTSSASPTRRRGRRRSSSDPARRAMFAWPRARGRGGPAGRPSARARRSVGASRRGTPSGAGPGTDPAWPGVRGGEAPAARRGGDPQARAGRARQRGDEGERPGPCRPCSCDSAVRPRRANVRRRLAAVLASAHTPSAITSAATGPSGPASTANRARRRWC